MPAKRPRSVRENVTPIKSVRGEAANESRPQDGAQDGFAPADKAGQPELEHAAAADAAEQILGANPLLGIDREELLAAGKRLLRLMGGYPSSNSMVAFVLGRCRATICCIVFFAFACCSGDSVRKSPVTSICSATTLRLPAPVPSVPVVSTFTCVPPIAKPGLNVRYASLESVV